MSCRYLATGAS